ncbi:MAG TPA: YDG domain-containing protein, partial [Rhodocyclaceae bacterium]|nr:YDG domain-containing protein [Rhodocyclaceae bacterium]
MNAPIPTSRDRRAKRRTPPSLRTLTVAVAACFAIGDAIALPAGAQVASGSASIQQNGNALTVVNSPGAIIHWNSFSIAQGETTHFIQTSASSTVLNRVVTAEPSLIYGNLTSNGGVWLINPAGIMVGPSGRIDVAGFVASTLGISNQDFLAGRKLFQGAPDAGNVINRGQIVTPHGGSVYLIGSNVSNESIITTPKGETLLAAGATVHLVDTATPGVKVEITGAAGNATNLGEITATAGRIGIAGVIVKNSGVLNASSVVEHGGRIFLKASKDAFVDQAGRIVTTGTTGGQVEVLGERVAVMDQATIDADGEHGGGRVMVGGDYQGKNPDIRNAKVTYIGPQAQIKADATKVGAGGTVVAWSDDTTRVYGTISARGGNLGGDGGFIETSGKRYLKVACAPDASASNGQGGVWLLDPYDIVIGASDVATSTLGINPLTYVASGTGSQILASTLSIALDSGVSVIVDTSGGGAEAGDITVSSSISTINAGASTLTLKAHNDITINAPQSMNNHLVLTANQNSSGTTGKIAFNSSVSAQSITASGKSIDFTGISSGVGLSTTGTISLTATAGAIISSPYGAVQEVVGASSLTLNAVNGIGNGKVFLANLNGPISFSNTGSGAVSITNHNSGSNRAFSGSNPNGSIRLESNDTAYATTLNNLSSGGDIVIRMNRLTLPGTINAGSNTVYLSPFNNSPVPDISIGGTQTFNLSGGDISNITAGKIVIGTDSFGNYAPNTYIASSEAVAVTGKNLEIRGNNIYGGPLGLSNSSGQITFIGDFMSIAATVSADQVWLKGKSTSQNIDLGGADTGGTLGLTSTELSYLNSANILRIGDSAATGTILVSDAIGGFNTLSLETGGTISQSATGVITANAIRAVGYGGVSLAATSSGNHILNYIAGKTLTGDFLFKNDSALTLHTVDAQAGIDAGANNVSMTAYGGFEQYDANAIIKANALTLGTTHSAGRILLNQGPHQVATFNSTNTGNISGIGAVFYNSKPTLTIGSVTQSPGGTTTLQNTGNIALGTIDGGGSSVKIEAINGTLTDTNGAAANISNASQLDINFSAATPQGIGAAIDPIEIANVALVSARTTAGGIFLEKITDANSLVLNGITHNGTSDNDIVIKSNTDIVNNAALTTTAGNNGNVTLLSAGLPGGITINSPMTKVGAGSLTLQTTGAATVIDIGNNVDGGVGNVVLSATGAINVTTGSPRNITGATLTASSGGAISGNNGAFSFSGPASFNAGAAAISLNNAANNFGDSVSLSNSGANAVSLTNSGSLKLGAVGVGAGTLTLQTGGALTQSGAITQAASAGTFTIIATNASTDIALASQANDISSPIAIGGTASNIRDFALRNISASATIPNLSGTSLRDLTLTFNSAAVAVPNITLTGNLAVAAGGAITQTAGGVVVPGTASFAAGANAIALNDPANNFGGAVGLSNSGAYNVSLRDSNALNLGAVGVGSGTLTVQSGGTLTINSSLSTTATGDALQLIGTRFINNVGAGALSATNGRWLVWSGTPADDTRNGLTYNFKQYNATYGGSTVSGSGNGVLYSVAPTISAALSGSIGKVYDATATASLSGSNYGVSGMLDGDTVTLNNPSNGVYDTANVAGGKTVTVSGLTIANATNGPASVYGYQLAGTTINGAIGTITAKPLTMSGLTVPASKVYDTTLTATVGGAAVLAAAESPGTGNSADGKPYSGDTVTIAGTAAGSYNAKNVATATTVTFSGLSLGGAQAGNYSLVLQSPAGASITPASLPVSGVTALNKVYDATTTATLSGVASVAPFSSDAVTVVGTGTASFLDKNVGAGKTVMASGFGLTGADAGNYSLAQPAGLSASITPYTLSVTGVAAQNKVYDATTAATLTGGAIASFYGDAVSLTSGIAAFDTKNVGASKTVTASGFGLTGADAGNYSLAQPTGLSASITPYNLSITGISAQNKIYDATTAATLTGGAIASFSGDAVSLTSGIAMFDTKNVGSGKTVTASGFGLTGADAGNYTLAQPAGLNASITPYNLSITGVAAQNKVYDATTTATLTGGAIASFYGDAVSLTAGIATFDTKNVGSGKTVTASGFGLTGADAGNYTLTQPTGLSASITPYTLSVTGVAAQNKVYDATTAATLTGGAIASFYGDAVSLTAGIAAFDTKNVG